MRSVRRYTHEAVVTGAIGWSHTTGKRRRKAAARLGIESLDKEPV